MVGLIKSFRSSIINNISPEIYNINSLNIKDGTVLE